MRSAFVEVCHDENNTNSNFNVNIYIEKISQIKKHKSWVNEKPLTKAVWRTKYKGFPLFFYVTLAVVLVCMCVYVCVFLGLFCDWTKGYRMKQCKGCMWWAVVTVLSCVRDLRNCCNCFFEMGFAENRAWSLTLLQTKEKVWWHAREGLNNPSETKPKPIWQKKEIARKHLQTKWKPKI